MADIVIANAKIFDGSGAQPFNGEVVIRGNRIETVTKTTSGLSSARGDVQVIDAAGACLMPGMTEAHTHFAWNDQPSLSAI